MKKKAGRPPKRPDQKAITPARQLGRVDDATWAELQAAAQREDKTFTAWAVEILKKAAKGKRR